MKEILRVLVTGQSPRPDVVAQFSAVALTVEVRIEGALDGMSRDQIVVRTQPTSDTDTLFVTLSSGEVVRVSKTMVADRLSARLQAYGPTLLWSTSSFQDLARRDDFVQPTDLLTALVDVLLSEGTLGLIVPRSQQLEIQTKERSRPGVRAVAEKLAPRSDCATIDAAARRLVTHKPDLVLMDSMSYTRSEMLKVSAILPCLVLLPAVIATGAAATLLDTSRVGSPLRKCRL